MTAAETVLWMHLKKRINGCKFRRQHPIENYIVDFHCHKIKVIVEIDRAIHNTPEQQLMDSLKEHDLTTWGYTILRFTNEDVLFSVDKILLEITQTVNKNLETVSKL